MDDHSSDKTADVISDLRILYDNIKFVADNPKLGNASRSFFYLMFEMADELSEFDYVALADHDDIWIPSKLERAVARLNFTNSVAYSSDFCAVTFDSGEGIVSGKLHRKSQPQTPIDYVFEGPGPGCTFVLTQQIFSMFVEELRSCYCEGRLDRVFWHDWFLYFYVRSKNLPWVIDNYSGIAYIQHGFNETGVNSGFAAYLKRLRLLFSGWYIDQAIVMMEILQADSVFLRRLKDDGLNSKLALLAKAPYLRRRRSHAVLMVISILFFLKRDGEN